MSSSAGGHVSSLILSTRQLRRTAAKFPLTKPAPMSTNFTAYSIPANI